MANRLKMAAVDSIYTLLEQGYPHRWIARTLKVDRGTVCRYAKRLRQASNAAGAPSGPEPPSSNTAGAPPGSTGLVAPGETLPPVPPAASACLPFHEAILAKLEQGLSATRIWQDLVGDHQFAAKYHSVRRYVQKLGQASPQPFRRMECEPGAEAQVDFGTGAPVVIPASEPLLLGVKNRRRHTHVFRIVLSHSRKAYSEAVYRQTTEDFIRCLENAFWHFGGVPKTLVVDNLKAAVIKADWYDPDLNPKIQSFCRHYGTVILPTKPRTPRHKGKTEKGIDYVQSNALKGRTFTSLAEENGHLLTWEAQTADLRIHGTTQKQVKKCFEEAERPALLPLPVNRFPPFEEGKRKVGRDGHVEVAKAYYSVPPEYLGRSVWVRWDTHTVRIFNHQFQQVEIHPRQEPGRFSTHDRNIPAKKRSGIERGAAYNLNKASLIGPQTGRWAEQMVQQRGIEGVRVLLGLLSLSKRHHADVIERACEAALRHGAYRLHTIRKLIKRQGDRQEQFEFIEEHPIIRSLSEYGDLVHAALQKGECPEEKWS